ncbi:hypothetical protein [Rhizobium giardinii]|nr:hypothetical protein [Rhizobium giardinii]
MKVQLWRGQTKPTRAKDEVTPDVEKADGLSVDHLFTSSWLPE